MGKSKNERENRRHSQGSENQTKKKESARMGIEPMAFKLALRLTTDLPRPTPKLKRPPHSMILLGSCWAMLTFYLSLSTSRRVFLIPTFPSAQADEFLEPDVSDRIALSFFKELFKKVP